VALLPIAAVVMPVSQVSPRLVTRFGVRAVMVAGLVLLASGFVILAQLTESSGYAPFLIGLMVFGVGLAMSSTPATTAIVNSLPLAKQGVASAVNDTTREIGSALGVALLGSIYGTAYTSSVKDSLTALPPKAAHARVGIGGRRTSHCWPNRWPDRRPTRPRRPGCVHRRPQYVAHCRDRRARDRRCPRAVARPSPGRATGRR